MRTCLGAVAVSTAVILVSVPNLASAKVIEVDGDRLSQSGLVPVLSGCTDPEREPDEEPVFLIGKGSTESGAGRHSSGWALSETKIGAGSVARITSPTTLSRFRIQLNAPEGEALGSAYVRYYPEDDSGYWLGLRAFDTDRTEGWHVVDALDRSLYWLYFDSSGDAEDRAPRATVVDHVEEYGGDGGGADLGFIFGCNGEPFYVDKLQLKTAEEADTYDYGGFRTRAELRLGSRKPAKTKATFGRKLSFKGRLFEKYADGRLPGSLHLQVKPLKRGSWKTVKRVESGRKDSAEMTIKPAHNSVYRISYQGTASTFEPDVSNLVKVRVKMRARASFADSTVTRGQRFAVVGRVWPAKRTKVVVQRHLKGSWRAIRKGRSSASGRFRIGGTARDAGVSHWRLQVAGGATNVRGTSQRMKLTVRKPPPPPTGGGGGGGGGEVPPPPPPNNPPPPPEG